MSVIGNLAGGADRVVGGIIALQDNATGVLQSIRQEQSRFRQDIAQTRQRLIDTFNQRYRTQVETAPAVQAIGRVTSRLRPLRQRVVTTLAVADLATAPIRATIRQARALGSELGKIGGKIKNLAKGVAIPVGIVGAAGTAALTALFSGSSEAAKAQIEAETKLETVLGNVASIQARGAGAAAEAKANLMGVASSLQNVGVIGDEVTLAGMQQLATFQLSDKEISILAPGLTDLLAQQKGLNASQQDAVTYGNLIGKVMQGQTSALSRVGITFNEVQERALQTGSAEQRAAVLAEILQQNVGGVNQALAETDQGKIQQMANAWGDMKEEVGKVSLSIKSKFASVIMKNIAPIQKLGTTFMGTLDKIADSFMPIADVAIGKVAPAVESLLDKIGNFTLSNNFTDRLMSIFEAASPIVKGVLKELGEAAKTLAPVFGAVFDGISQKVGAALNFVGSKMGWVQKIISKSAPVIASIIKTSWSVISPVLDIAGSAFKVLFNVTSRVFEGIVDVVSAVWGKLEPIIQKVAGGLEWISDKVSKLTGGSAADVNIGGKSGKVKQESGAEDNTGTSKVSRPKIGRNAKGDDNWRGGLTWVGEEGPELVELPGGSRILPNRESITVAATMAAPQPAPAQIIQSVQTEQPKINLEPVIKPNFTVIEGGLGGVSAAKPDYTPVIPTAANKPTEGAYAGLLGVMDKRLANIESRAQQTETVMPPSPAPAQISQTIQPERLNINLEPIIKQERPAISLQPVIKQEQPLPLPGGGAKTQPAFAPAPNASQSNQSSGGNNNSWKIELNIAKLADSIEVRSDEDIDAIGEAVVKKVLLALKNAPSGA